MIYTGYFSSPLLRNNKDVILISVSRKTPDWFNGIFLDCVAPPMELVSLYKKFGGTPDIEKFYREQYLSETLGKVSIEYLRRFFGRFNKDVVLCCYEISNAFCHRHILGEWLRDNGFDFGGEYPGNVGGSTDV